jgi:hypothetical protein
MSNQPTGRLGMRPTKLIPAIDLHFHDLRHSRIALARSQNAAASHQRTAGHANISQTDTNLNAGRLALQDSTKRFDASRGKSVANVPPIEHRPDGHVIPKETPKDQLH